MLKTSSLEFQRQGLTLLSRVNLDLCEGELRFLVGPSGAGKSTLLRLIAGLESPSEGSIEIDGKLASNRGNVLVPPHRRGIAMVFQDGGLWPHMSVENHLLFGMDARIPDRSRRNEYTTELLELFELEDRRQARPGHLSGGERQRLAMARALAQDARLLLLDEPLAHVDLARQRSLAQAIGRILKTRQVTAIWVTHRPAEVEFLGGSVSIMASGGIVKQVSAEDAHAWLSQI